MLSKKFKLAQFISSQFFKAALLPLLVIEVALVVLYFSINLFNDHQTKNTLEAISKSQLQQIAVSQADTISRQLGDVTSLSGILMKETGRFFAAPELFPGPPAPAKFGVAPNGVYYKTADNGGASLFYSARTSIGAAEMKQASSTEALDPLYRHVFESNRNIVAIYLNTFDSMCRYYPFIKDVYQQFPRDMDIPAYNFYYLADASHNPEKRTVWTEAYLDPAGQGWMMSCISPVYHGDRLKGVVGIDITIDRFINNILALRLPWGAQAFLVDPHGTIMAMPPDVERILGLAELHKYVYEGQIRADTFKPEQFNLLAGKNPELSKAVSMLMKTDTGVRELTLDGVPYFLTQVTVSETGWKLFILTAKNHVLKPILILEKNTRLIGYLAIGVMVLFYFFFFIYLFRNTRKIAAQLVQPVTGIVKASARLAQGDYNTRLQVCGLEELDTLSASFETMARELQVLYADLEAKVEDRTRLLKETQAQLIQSEKMASIGQLAAGVAHEINNPMAFVIGNIDVLAQYWESMSLLLRKYAALEQALTGAALPHIADVLKEIEDLRQTAEINAMVQDMPQLLEQSAQGADRVKKIVRDLMIFSRVEEQQCKAVSINELLDSTITIIASEIRHKAELVRKYGEDLPPVMCYSRQISQVFMNILMNAVQAIEVRGVITVETHREKDRVVIEISDTGAGIPEDVQTRIFDPFFTTKPVGKGTGLGLSVTYSIIQMHNGEISVRSKLKEGTTFSIRLPLS